MEEKWMIIPHTEGLYEVSNYGRVRSKNKIIKKIVKGTQCESFHKGTVLKPSDNGHGYYFVYLYIKRKPKRFYVHRLVALAWISNPLNLPFVNHKDWNKKNNNVDNIEWCTNSYNQLHRYNVLNKKNKMKGKSLSANYKKVALYEDGEIKQTFNSLLECSKLLRINYSNISSIINGKRKGTLDLRKYEN